VLRRWAAGERALAALEALLEAQRRAMSAGDLAAMQDAHANLHGLLSNPAWRRDAARAPSQIRVQAALKAAAINAKGLEFNRRGALMEGVFPKAASREEFQNKSLEFSELIIGGSGRTSVYQRLFDSARAGEPMPASQMRTLLTDA
jgi:hypothetical protein